MARQANILSFDEAKRDLGASRSSIAAAMRQPPRALADFPASELSSRRVPPTRSATARPEIGRGAHARRTASSRAVGFDGARSRAVSAEQTRGRRVSAVSSEQAKGARAPERSASAGRPIGGGRAAVSSDEPQAEKKPSRLKAFKRTRAKDKAERAFAKQFGGSDAASDASAAGPRAAVYKGEMGSKHRQAARMQNGASEAASAKRGASLGLLARIKTSPKFIASAAVAACLALSCVFLYPAAQQYYQAVRENDRLAAEYAAIEERNAALETDVATLQTDAGVETRAHEQLGWVQNGWETANVRGLDLEDAQDEASFRANIVPGSIHAPETWYSPFLDALFGVE